LGHLALNAPNILGRRKGLEDKNVIFKTLPDLLRLFQSITFHFSILFVSNDVEVLFFPCFVNSRQILFILSLSFGLNNNFVHFFFTILQLELENFAQSEGLQVDFTNIFAGFFHDSLPMAFIDEWLLQRFNQRKGVLETQDSDSQFHEWMDCLKLWVCV
jgi:hypothetical protein